MSDHKRFNNFDLVRLFAAAQVVFVHAVGHSPVRENSAPWVRKLLDVIILFPGVAVFFVVSGFLIAKSYERLRPEPRLFLWHRLLRIYPALVICLGISLLALAALGFLTPEVLGQPEFWVWLGGQLTFGQFYNPEFFRGFGLGVVNGALWTISVELQFYLLVPLFYKVVFPISGKRPWGFAPLWVSFFLSFAAFWQVDAAINGPGGFTYAPLAAKLLFVSLVPHWWMFLLGLLIHRHWDRLGRFCEGKFAVWIAAYGAVAVLRQLVLGRDTSWQTLYYLGYLPERILLAAATIAAAYTARGTASRWLGGTDVSYGIYIYHFLLINVLMEMGYMTGLGSVAAVFALSAALGLASWHLVEKQALALKSRFSGKSPAGAVAGNPTEA
jgi:peptidoglycan/LPS O-acetylase OafA/YrhL